MAFMDLPSKLSSFSAHLLQTTKKGRGESYDTPYFAAGKVFTASVFDLLLAQTYYSKWSLALAKALAGYSSGASSEKSNLVMIRPPPKIEEKNKDWDFQDLFK